MSVPGSPHPIWRLPQNWDYRHAVPGGRNNRHTIWPSHQSPYHMSHTAF